MEIAVWIVASVLAFNLLMLGTFALLASHGRHRARREMRQLESLWRPKPSAVSRLRNRKIVALSASAALVWAGVAFAALPETRRILGAALEAVVPEILGDDTGRLDRATEAGSDRASGPGAASSDREERTDRAHRAGRAEDAGTATGPGTPGVGGSSPASGTDDVVPGFVSAQTLSAGMIHVSWGPVSEATGYGIERSASGAAGWVTVATVGEEVTAYTDAGLAPEETYFYRVLVELEVGTAPPSDVVSATTAVVAPSSPVVEVTSRSRRSVALSWADVADETGYRIERSVGGDGGWVTIGTTGRDVSTYTDTGLDPGMTYAYRVLAINDGGVSEPSNVVSATTNKGVGDTDGPDDDAGSGGGGDAVDDGVDGTGASDADDQGAGTGEDDATDGDEPAARGKPTGGPDHAATGPSSPGGAPEDLR